MRYMHCTPIVFYTFIIGSATAKLVFIITILERICICACLRTYVYIQYRVCIWNVLDSVFKYINVDIRGNFLEKSIRSIVLLKVY